MNIIFSVNGGMGKSIFATAVCKAIKKKYPESKLIVLTGYPDVFLNIPYVDMAFPQGQEHYFYEKYIQGQKVKIFAQEPYLVTEHINQEEHIIESWCRLCGVPYNGEQPEVGITERESTYFFNKYQTSKPIMVIQTNGGGQQEHKYSWSRDMPRFVAHAIIQEYSNKYHIYHIKREDQIAYEGTTAVQESYKAIAVIIAMSQKRLFIDSFCQHLSKALNKKSTVLWICNSPKVFGYHTHDNIVANPETRKPDLRYSQFSKYNISGALHEFPYEQESEIFNIDSIMKSLNSQ